MNKMQVKLDDPNGKPERGVTLFIDGHEPYYEAVRLSSGFQRQQFVKRAAERVGRDVKDLATLDDLLVKKAIESASGGDAIRFDGIMLSELNKQQYRTDYIVQDALVAGVPTFIAGAQKTLKTSIAVDLGISIATGRPFLDRFEVNRCANVGFMSGEGGYSVLQDVCRRVCASKQVEPEGISGFILCDRLPRLDRADHLVALKQFLESHEIEVLFCDPVYLALGGVDAHNLLAMGERLSAIGEVCTAAGATVVLLHHTRKNIATTGQFAPAELVDLSWSGFSEYAGSWILLSRRERYVPSPLAEHKLWLSLGGRSGHSSLWGVDVREGVSTADGGRYWDISTMTAEEARSEAGDRDEEAREVERTVRHEKQLEADRQKVCRALAKFPGGETQHVLRGFAGMSGQRFTLALADLLQSDDVEPVQISKPGRRTPHDAYRLAERTSPHE